MEPEQQNAFILDIFIVNEIHIAQLINPQGHTFDETPNGYSYWISFDGSDLFATLIVVSLLYIQTFYS